MSDNREYYIAIVTVSEGRCVGCGASLVPTISARWSSLKLHELFVTSVIFGTPLHLPL